MSDTHPPSSPVDGKAWITEIVVKVYADKDRPELDPDTTNGSENIDVLHDCFEEGIAAGLNRAIERFPDARVRIVVNGEFWNV